MHLFDYLDSGNGYKVRLLLTQLGIPCDIVEVDILKGESRTPEFLKINPNGRTPVLDDNGFILAESNAILLAYLARGTKYLRGYAGGPKFNFPGWMTCDIALASLLRIRARPRHARLRCRRREARPPSARRSLRNVGGADRPHVGGF